MCSNGVLLFFDRSAGGSVRCVTCRRTCGWTWRMAKCCVGVETSTAQVEITTLFSTSRRQATHWLSNWAPSPLTELVNLTTAQPRWNEEYKNIMSLTNVWTTLKKSKPVCVRTYKLWPRTEGVFCDVQHWRLKCTVLLFTSNTEEQNHHTTVLIFLELSNKNN